jgi:hypothetical protein
MLTWASAPVGDPEKLMAASSGPLPPTAVLHPLAFPRQAPRFRAKVLRSLGTRSGVSETVLRLRPPFAPERAAFGTGDRRKPRLSKHPFLETP